MSPTAMEKATILVTGCGAFTGLEVVRSLRMGASSEHLIGTELSWFGHQVANRECDTVNLVPRADDEKYAEAMQDVVNRQNVDLIFLNYDIELEHLANWRDGVDVAFSCPDTDAIENCLNKKRTFELASTRVPVPGTRTVRELSDVQSCLEVFGEKIWLRCTTGQSGNGSIVITKAHQAISWMRYWREIKQVEDTWLAHEFLPGRNLNWTSLWYDGELVCSVAGERLAYFLAASSVSGVTGNVSHCRTVEGREANEIGEEAVRAVAKRPHGLFSVDMVEDESGLPNLTEVNARCAFRPLLLTMAGVNFPRILADLLLYEKYPRLPRHDAATLGVEMYRGMDVEPMFKFPGD